MHHRCTTIYYSHGTWYQYWRQSIALLIPSQVSQNCFNRLLCWLVDWRQDFFASPNAKWFFPSRRNGGNSTRGISTESTQNLKEHRRRQSIQFTMFRRSHHPPRNTATTTVTAKKMKNGTVTWYAATPKRRLRSSKTVPVEDIYR